MFGIPSASVSGAHRRGRRQDRERARRLGSPPQVASGAGLARRPTTTQATSWWPLAAIVVVCALTYANGLWHPFIFDDFGTVVFNPQIRNLWDVARVFAPLAESPVAGRPLVNLSFAINYAIGGLHVFGYHVGNLALHLGCALVAFGLVRRTLDTPGLSGVFGLPSTAIALAVAIVWSVHPLTSEVVDYITQRSESMMALCYLLTLYASRRAFDPGRRTAWLAAAVVASAAGMACKESMVSAPLMVALYDRVFLYDSLRQAARSRWRLYVGLGTTWLVLAILLASHPRTSSAGFATTPVSVGTYLLNQSQMVTHYLRLAVWPHPLVLYYGWPQALTIADVWPQTCLLVALVMAAVVAFIVRPRAGFLGLWVIVTLAPSSSFVPVGSEVGAERRMYLPLIALVTLAVVGVALAQGWFERRSSDTRGAMPARVSLTVTLVLVLLTATLSATTVARNREYASALTMARTVLTRWPGPSADDMVGTELARAGQHAEAIQYLRLAAPSYPPAHYNLGSELLAVGRFDEAIAELQTLIQDEPQLSTTVSARLLMGRAFEAKQRWPEAIAQFRLALAKDPLNPDPHGLLAQALATTQAFEESIGHYQAFLAQRPTDAGAWNGLGIALVATGRAVESIPAFRQAVDLEPRNTHFQANLARALIDQGDMAEAAGHVQQAVGLTPSDPAVLELLGRVRESQGRTEEARHAFQQALRLDPSYEPAREGLRRVGG